MLEFMKPNEKKSQWESMGTILAQVSYLTIPRCFTG